MAKIIHSTSTVPVSLVKEMNKLLWSEPDIIRRQMVIEWLVVAHASRMGPDAHVVIDAICKHAKQLLAEFGKQLQPVEPE